MQKMPMPGPSVAFLAKRPHLESGTETHPGYKKFTCVVSLPVLLMLGRMGAVGVGTPDVS